MSERDMIIQEDQLPRSSLSTKCPVAISSLFECFTQKGSYTLFPDVCYHITSCIVDTL